MSRPDPIRPATAADLAAMNAMILRAKAHWGYDAAFMAAARDELTHSLDELGRDLVIWVGPDGVPLGMAKVSAIAIEGVAQLDSLFVDPEGMGAGIGRALFDWATARLVEKGAARMKIDSDPFAEPFYLRMGARRIGEAPSGSIPGRMLPLLEFSLDPHGTPSQS